MIKKVLKITLKSDMCLASGYSYAGIIDSDTSYDAYGIPYIPARRLRGCLRDVAELFAGVEQAEKLFGKSGMSISEKSPLIIKNGHIKGYRSMIAFFENNKKICTKEKVLNQFSMVKSQTRLSREGIADDNSLRFTRIINHFSPIDYNGMVFYAPVIINGRDDNEEKEFVDYLEGYAKALRHMGYNRNRGLGNVVCRLEDVTDELKKEFPLEVKIEEKAKDGEVELHYCIRTESPIIISQGNGMETDAYINGRAVVGFFASKYLKDGHTADKEFEDIFLRGNVHFSPLYPSNEDGKKYVPVPEYIGELKKSKYLVNTSAKPKEDVAEILNPKHGNQPKKLKNKYISLDNALDLIEVSKDIIYHNRHEKQDEEALLYGHEAISEGQYFAGTITGDYNKVQKLKKYLEDSRITFGKSLSAQYGNCSLVSGCIERKMDKYLSLKEGEEFFVVLESDGIFINQNETGNWVNTCQPDFVKSYILRYLNADIKVSDYTEINAKKNTGYYGIWNMKRATIPVVGAGSCFSFCAKKDLDIPERIFLGENTIEGFGIARTLKRPQEWKLKEPQKNEKDSENINIIDKANELYTKLEDINIKSIVKNIMLEEAMNISKEIALKVEKTSLNAAAIGRLSLMLMECENENIGHLEKVKTALDNRIESIKGNEKKEEAKNVVNLFYDLTEEKNFDLKIKEYFSEEEQAVIRFECLRNALINMKYKAKGDK